MLFPRLGHPSADHEALKEHPKSPFLKSAIKSFLSRLTPIHRTFLFLLILFQILLLLYITRSPNLSLPESPKHPPVFQPSERDQNQFQPKFQASRPELGEKIQDPEPDEKQFRASQPRFRDSEPDPTTSRASECDSRRIYVYDLPPMFNYDIQSRCDRLDPWYDKCNKNLNEGFGPEAKELAGIVPASILPAWYWTDHYWGEVVYHRRMLNYKCRTLEPGSATAFYIPFYAGLAVGGYLWGNHTVGERDWYCEKIMEWVQEQKWWKRSNGSDHIIMLGRLTWAFRRMREDPGWGAYFIHRPEMKNVVRLAVERNVFDDLEVAVPYPTIFHPRSESDIIEWQRFVRGHRRSHLFTFVGGKRKWIKDDFRGVLQDQCLKAKPAVCRHVDCARENCLDGTTAIMSAFLDSDFCLQPRGDGFTRRSVLDCMMAGSIPVFFWRRTAYLQYENDWFLPGEPESYSVFIDRGDVRNGTDIKRVLEGYGREEVHRMREKIVESIPKFLYAKSSQGLEKTRDAFDIAIDGVLNKYKDHMKKGIIENRKEI